MTALAAAAERLFRNTKGQVVHEYVVGTGAKIYHGALVTLNSAGTRAIAGAAAAANGDFVGVAIDTATGVTAATVYIKVVSECEAKFAITTSALTSADLGGLVAIKDDNTITTASDAGTTAKQHLVGVATESAASGVWWVFLTRSGTAANAVS